ncbi:MAG: LegC family aminotransferase [Anaerolineae bacterium]
MNKIDELALVPLCVPEIRGNEWKYIKECLDTNWVSSGGSYVSQFESMLAGRIGTSDAVATVNGTAALHMALLCCGVEADDEVLVSNLTFIAPVNAIRYIGAFPVLMDADPTFWQMDVDKFTNFVEQECIWKDGALWNKKSGRKVKAIVPVHILGHPCDMDPILEIARKYNLKVIEDATESLGAKYKDRIVGSMGDCACFSFNGNKLITTGGGGMIVSNNPQIIERAKYLTTQAKDDPIEYIHSEVGYNYRLTNIQAAMGCAQLEQVDEYIATKRRTADSYEKAFRTVEKIVTMPEASWATSAKWLYTILVDGGSRGLMAHLKKNKIQTRPLWHPIHKNPAYQNFEAYHCDNSILLNDNALSLPCSVGISDQDLARTIETILNYLE